MTDLVAVRPIFNFWLILRFGGQLHHFELFTRFSYRRIEKYLSKAESLITEFCKVFNTDDTQFVFNIIQFLCIYPDRTKYFQFHMSIN